MQLARRRFRWGRAQRGRGQQAGDRQPEKQDSNRQASGRQQRASGEQRSARHTGHRQARNQATSRRLGRARRPRSALFQSAAGAQTCPIVVGPRGGSPRGAPARKRPGLPDAPNGPLDPP